MHLTCQRLRASLLCAALLVFAAACGTTSVPPLAEPGTAQRLRVMTFNIEYGGKHVSFDNVVAAIRLAGADIVGIQEAEGNLAELAHELGWYYDLRNYAISRFPIYNPAGADGRYVYIEVAPGAVVALANVHLPSDPYGPDRIRDGAALDEVLDIERRLRVTRITPYLDALQPLLANDLPVFLTGDFNTPSHSDWVPQTVGERPFLRYPVPWPVTEHVAAAGFKDSWRTAHPDPVAAPGLTWWAGRPPLDFYAPGENDAEDRIDFIWYSGSVTVAGSELVGEQDGPGVGLAVMPWPSDHRAVVSEFIVQPAVMPPLLTTRERVYAEGDEVELIYRQLPSARIELSHAIEAPGTTRQAIQSYDVSGDGRTTVAGRRLAPGPYRASLYLPHRAPQHMPFWVAATDAEPGITVHGKHFAAGEAIDIDWRDGPGLRNDYIGIVAEGTEPGYDQAATWIYVNALPSGSLRLDAVTAEGAWPLAPGRYLARLLKDDGYEVLAESTVFEIR